MALGKAGSVVARELRHLVPPTLFFLVAFNLLAFCVAVLWHGTGGIPPTYAAATIAALVCGKAVLLADKLPFFNRFPDRPLVWNVAWKTLVCVLVALVIQVLEHLLSAATGDYGFRTGVQNAVSQFTWARFTAVQILLGWLFFGYFAFAEMVAVFGYERMRRLCFGPLEPGDLTRGAPVER